MSVLSKVGKRILRTLIFHEPTLEKTYILEESEKQDVFGEGPKTDSKNKTDPGDNTNQGSKAGTADKTGQGKANNTDPGKKPGSVNETGEGNGRGSEKNREENDNSKQNEEGSPGKVRKILKPIPVGVDDLSKDGNDSGKNKGGQNGEDSKNKKETQNEDSQNEEDSQSEEESEISTDIKENLEYMKNAYSIPLSGDVVIREFDITIGEKNIEAFVIFIDGLIDSTVLNHFVLEPLMLLSNLDIKYVQKDIKTIILKQLLPYNQVKTVSFYKEVLENVNFGSCALFVDGLNVVFTADVKGWEHRGVERPNTELVIRGPQEGFNEVLRANTALIRKIVLNENLIVENLKVGRRSRTPCALLYIRDIANKTLVDEVRRRIKSLDIDSITDSGELEQFLEDNTFLPAPQILATERPDRVASMLEEGKVAIVMQGSPFVLVMPTTISTLVQSPEDTYMRFPGGNLFRIVRFLGIFVALLLPGLYVAITNYHQEMIPTDLVLAISAARERVPFPSVLEILIMEISFELIREAGIRIPGPIGPTLGIIGALILGQAAVAANIVSPILIIVVAVTGIGSFAIPNFSLALSLRIVRFAYIALGAVAGFLGITTGIFIQGIIYAKAKSFGVPFLTPFGPKTAGAAQDDFLNLPIWKREERPDYLNTGKRRKQDSISRKWIVREKGSDES